MEDGTGQGTSRSLRCFLLPSFFSSHKNASLVLHSITLLFIHQKHLSSLPGAGAGTLLLHSLHWYPGIHSLLFHASSPFMESITLLLASDCIALRPRVTAFAKPSTHMFSFPFNIRVGQWDPHKSLRRAILCIFVLCDLSNKRWEPLAEICYM